MQSIRSIIKAFLFLILFGITANGQEPSIITNSADTTLTVFEMQKSPWGAVLRSALLPGLGQFYNESYWKIPVIWGVGALLVSGWVYNNNRYISNKDLYIDTGSDLYRQRRDFYRDQRDNFTIYLVITYLLNLVDAYVDAHLFDFRVEEYFNSSSSVLYFRYNLN